MATIQEQIIEVPRVEYQDVEGTTYMEAVQAPTVRQAQPGTTRQERVVGPDLDPVVMQAAPQPVAQPVMQTVAAPTTTYAQPTTLAAPTTTLAAPAYPVGGSVM